MQYINAEYFKAFDIDATPAFVHGHEDLDSSVVYTIVEAIRYSNDLTTYVDISSLVSQVNNTIEYSSIWLPGETPLAGLYRVRTILKTPDGKTVIELNSMITIQEKV